jgi:DNA-binding NtrC family response regulator
MVDLRKDENNHDYSLSSYNQSIAKVLVIEDQEYQLEALHEILIIRGYSPTSAKNAQEGLDYVMGNTYDIALIDIMLPDGNGLDLLKLFSDNYKHMSNIIMTGHWSLEIASKAIALGADGYLEKPFEFETLEQLMIKCLDKKKKIEDDEINQISLRSSQKHDEREIDLMNRFYK